MLSHIRQQLAQNWHEDLNKSTTTVGASPINRQLNYQTQYNTSLLSQIEELEVECSKLRSLLSAAESGRVDLKETSREAELRANDLHRKLTISSQLCDRLSEQCNELRESKHAIEADYQKSLAELEDLKDVHKAVLEQNNELTTRVNQLQIRLQNSESGRNWESNEGKARTGALNSSLANITDELSSAYIRIASLEKDLSQMAEENLNAQRNFDHMHSRFESEENSKKILQNELNKTSAELLHMQRRTMELEQQKRVYEESIEIRELERDYADRAHNLAAEMSHRADEKWRQLEELVRTRERELVIASEDKVIHTCAESVHDLISLHTMTLHRSDWKD